MIGRSLVAKHDAVESIVVSKFIEHSKAESISVELHDFGQMVRGACHPQMGLCQTYCCLVHRLLLARNCSDNKLLQRKGNGHVNAGASREHLAARCGLFLSGCA